MKTQKGYTLKMSKREPRSTAAVAVFWAVVLLYIWLHASFLTDAGQLF